MPERLVQDDCELRALAVEEPRERTLSKSNNYTETYIETSTGRQSAPLSLVQILVRYCALIGWDHAINTRVKAPKIPKLWAFLAFRRVFMS